MSEADKYSFRSGLYLHIYLTFTCFFIIFSEIVKHWTKGTEVLEWIIGTTVLEITNSEFYDLCDFEFSLSVNHRASQIGRCALREVYWEQFCKIAVLGHSCADPFLGERAGKEILLHNILGLWQSVCSPVTAIAFSCSKADDFPPSFKIFNYYYFWLHGANKNFIWISLPEASIMQYT